jgi:hypothetical protein
MYIFNFNFNFNLPCFCLSKCFFHYFSALNKIPPAQVWNTDRFVRDLHVTLLVLPSGAASGTPAGRQFCNTGR